MPSTKSLLIALANAKRELSPAAYAWFQNLDFFTADELAEALGLENAVVSVRRWRSQGKLIGVPISRGMIYPTFQVERDQSRLDADVVRANLRIAHLSPWQQIAWWATNHPGLDEQTLVTTARQPSRSSRGHDRKGA